MCGGLYLRISPKLARYFFFRCMLNGKRRDLGLGSYPELSLADARLKAIQARRLKAKDVDPVQARRETEAIVRRDQSAAAWTFKKCAEEVHRTLSPGWRNSKHGKQ